jgi:murein DD-endopeptidase MepM/ murein hydrolase activator NlpD
LRTDTDRLRARALLIPVRGLDPRSVRDSFVDNRGGRHHEAIDLLAPRGTSVLAVEDGRIERLFTSRLGGLTIYQFDPRAEYCYYYAHLDRYAAGLAEGMAVRRGDVIGQVGTTGNAPPGTPHLHFAIRRLGPEKRWWEGTAVNAYALWAEAVAP